MADLRVSFPILEDAGTQAGLPLHKVAAGDSSAARNAASVFPAVDAGGLLRQLKVNAAGELLTSDAADVANLHDTGTHAGSTSDQTLVEITLQPSTVYRELKGLLSSFRDSLGRVDLVDDSGGTPVTTNIHSGSRVGPGQYSASLDLDVEFTTGAVGIPLLRLIAKNTIVASTMDATLSIKEAQ